MTTPETERDRLQALGYRVIDVSNAHAENAWIVQMPGNTDTVLLVGSEAEGWKRAAEHQAANKVEPTVTDEDRAAFIAFNDEHQLKPPAFRVNVALGHLDDHPMMEAFARHREQATASLKAEVDRWFKAYGLAVDQAMENGQAAASLREERDALRGVVDDTQATLSAVKAEAIVDGGGTCLWIAESLNQQMIENMAALSKLQGAANG